MAAARLEQSRSTAGRGKAAQNTDEKKKARARKFRQGGTSTRKVKTPWAVLKEEQALDKRGQPACLPRGDKEE